MRMGIKYEFAVDADAALAEDIELNCKKTMIKKKEWL